MSVVCFVFPEKIVSGGNWREERLNCLVELEELQFDKISSQLKSFSYYQDRQRFFPEKLIDRKPWKY